MLHAALHIFLHAIEQQLRQCSPGAGAAVAAATAPPPGIPPPAAATAEPLHRQADRYAWALLLARIYAVFPLPCPKCGGAMRIVAFITEAVVVRDILRHLGAPSTPPTIAQARGPPLWAAVDAALLDSIPAADLSPPPPTYEFDQGRAWSLPWQDEPTRPVRGRLVPATARLAGCGQPLGTITTNRPWPALRPGGCRRNLPVDCDQPLRNTPLGPLEFPFLQEALGETRAFARANGFYLAPVSPQLPTLPEGWQDRLLRVPLADELVVWFLEPNDAAVSKYARGEPRDREWIRAGLAAGLLAPTIIESRLRMTDFLDENESARARRALADDRMASGITKPPRSR